MSTESNERQFTFSGEIVEVGDGCITLMHEGLHLSVPCRSDVERWGGENLYKSIEVQMTVKVVE